MATDKSGKGNKRKRKTKRSMGVHGGGGKVRLTPLQKALMGKGLMHDPLKFIPGVSHEARKSKKAA